MNICIFFVCSLISYVISQEIQSRHMRPPSQHSYKKCDRFGCVVKIGYLEDDYDADKFNPEDEARPEILGKDDWPVRPNKGRPGIGADFKPAGSDESDSFNPNSKVDRISESKEDYKPKPIESGSDKLTPAGGYNPKGDEDYNPKAVDSGSDYNPNPKNVDKDDYSPKPVGGGGGYTPKNDDKSGFNPKPSGESSYNPKPTDKDNYNPRPVGGGGGYNPKPVDKDDYNPRPVGGGGSYNPKPVDKDDYNPRPVGGGYNPKPADKDDDNPRPDRGGGYNPKPVDKDDYNPRPVGGGGYNPKPVDKDDYNPRPVGGGGGYNPKPVDKDDYNPRPVGGGGGDYKPKPVDKDDYNPRPVGGGGGYNPKPVDKDDYNPRPVGGGGGGYNPKPVDRDDYNPRPVGGGGGYNPKPVDKDDYNPRPVGGVGDYKPKPGDNKPQPNQPKVTDEDEYKRRHIGYPSDYEGYDDYGTVYDDANDYDDGKKPFPVIDGGNCICVPYYQCRDGHIVTDGGGIIDARKRPDPDEELPLDGKFRPPSCGPFHVCCNTPESSTVKPYEHRCGVRNPSGINSRILSPSNKGEADFGEWPWQAAVLKSEGKINIFQCGGVLIDKYHVLTVAHCVFHLYKYNEYPLKVRLGEWDTQTTGEFLAHEDYKVSKIIVHPEYRNTSLWNDIAILKLEEPVLFAPHIDTVCLPQYDEIFAGQNCVVTGWGKDAYKGGTFSNVMKEVAIQVIDNYKCEEMLRKTRLGRFFQLHEGFICAGGEHGLDSCKGDGGGPLVCYRKDKSYALAGIVSWGIDCGQPGVPGVYVKIQKFLEWISKNTGVNLQDYWPKV